MNNRNPNQPTSTQPIKAVLYARVSSKEQEKEGFSIPSQEKLLRGYAADNRITISGEYVDIETAKESGRVNFEAMLAYLKSHPTVRAVLVEKTDRLYRNLKDWVRLDELDIEIHLVKEGVVLSRDSRSSEKFVHGIKVLMAKNYIDNLSEEARKGMQEKAEQGIWPTVAPLGYLNVTGPDGKKIIDVDPKIGPIVTHMFGWYATGTLSIAELAEKARGAGLFYRKSGAGVPRSIIHTMLRNPLYTGDIVWKGQYFRGKHPPLVTHALWERVQGVLNGRNARKEKKSKRDFAFAGVVKCGHCGCAMVGEIKKQRYVYYHCTGWKGKCPEPYVREEVIEKQFCQALAKLQFGDKALSWLKEALAESHVDEAKEHAEAIQRLQAEYERLQSRVHAIYVDKLDGTINKPMFEDLSRKWRKHQDTILDQIALHQAADQSYLEEGAQLLDLASNAHRAFRRQDGSEKRRLLNFILSNSTWKNGTLTPEWRQPFDLLAETAALAAMEEARAGEDSARCKVWLPGPDSNQRPSG
jgi:site-specific DNA recombinase